MTGKHPRMPLPITKTGRPATLNILGKLYTITYTDNPSEVDMNRRESLWGQIDFWKRTIKIYDNGRGAEDLWQTIIHEILHGISESLKLKLRNADQHDDLDLLALALTDVLFRNDLIKLT